MRIVSRLLICIVLFGVGACNSKNAGPAKNEINSLELKRGAVISCGTADKQFGTVDFDISGTEKAQADFDLALKLLHSFEYDEAEKVFAKIIDEEPTCAMAYWGIAMANFHPLWTPPLEPELIKGSKAIDIAKNIKQKTARESDYINAIATFYTNWAKEPHKVRCNKFEEAMGNLSKKYTDDKEAATFYALALAAAADPADKTFAKQKKAGSILTGLYPAQPNHPGVVHYIIHTYDYPELATLALPAARKYAEVAPSSAHALHMPSHIFTRLGLWDECIQSNSASVSSAQCYAETAGIKGHWDEELHGLDYLVYAYLQKGDNAMAKKQYDYLKTIQSVSPLNFKVAYAFASIPSRYLLENKLWKEASVLRSHSSNFPWPTYPWQEALLHFTRLMGNAHLGKLDSARVQLFKLNDCYNKLYEQKDTYKAGQVQIQIISGEAWIQLAEGRQKEALISMNTAADLEDKTEKHPVTPGEVIPARELQGDMLMELHHYPQALLAYEAVLAKHPNRFNALYGAGMAAFKNNKQEKAKDYFSKLTAIASTGNADKPLLKMVQQYLTKQGTQFSKY